MWNILRYISFMLVLIQLLQMVHSAPFLLGKRHVKDNGHRRRLIKSTGKLENAEKKSSLHKKTTVSINGQFLPLAQLSTSDKNIHVTVQKANAPSQQLQPNIQEVSLGNQNLGNGGLQNPGVQTSVPLSQVGLHPGIQTSNNLGNGGLQNANVIGLSPGNTNDNGNQVIGMSPGINTNANQIGLHPGIQGNNIQNNAIPNQNQFQNQGLQANCGINNGQGLNNLNSQGQNLGNQGNQAQAILVKTANGDISYRPLAC